MSLECPWAPLLQAAPCPWLLPAHPAPSRSQEFLPGQTQGRPHKGWGHGVLGSRSPGAGRCPMGAVTGADSVAAMAALQSLPSPPSPRDTFHPAAPAEPPRLPLIDPQACPLPELRPGASSSVLPGQHRPLQGPNPARPSRWHRVAVVVAVGQVPSGARAGGQRCGAVVGVTRGGPQRAAAGENTRSGGPAPAVGPGLRARPGGVTKGTLPPAPSPRPRCRSGTWTPPT